MSDHGFASLGPALLARKGGARPAMRPQLPPPESSESEIAALADEQLEDLGWNDMGDGGNGNDSSEASAPRDHRGPGAEVVSITQNSADLPAATVSPIVHRQQKNLAQRLLADAVMPGGGEALEEDEGEDGEERLNEAGYDLNEADNDFTEADEGFGERESAYASLAPMTEPAPAAPKVSVVPSINPSVRAPASRAPAPRRMAAASTPRRAAFTLRLDGDRHLKLRLAATMQGVSAQALLTEALDAMLAEFDDLEAIAARLKRH